MEKDESEEQIELPESLQWLLASPWRIGGLIVVALVTAYFLLGHSVPDQPQLSAADHLNNAVTLSGQGRLEEAIKETRMSIELDSTMANAHYDLGYFLSLQGKMDEAIQETRKAIALSPTMANAHYNLGVWLEAAGQKDEAIAHYREALRTNPQMTNARSRLTAALGSHKP